MPAARQLRQTKGMSSEPNSFKRPLWPMIVLAVCALGAGISGTLLYTQNRAPKTVVSATPDAKSDAQPDAEMATNPLTDLPPAVQNLPKAPPSSVAQPVLPDTPPDLDAAPPAQALAGLTPPQTALTSGNWYFDHQNWPRAIAEYQKAIAGGIDNPDVRTDLGSSYRFMKQPKQAMEQYQIAQKQDPNHENSLFNQGGLYAFSLGQTAKGIGVWKAYLKKFPNGQSAAAARQLLQQAELGKPGAKPKDNA